uniref:Uncharacterized protein n=1 Tax=Panagrolaimus sp. JU765 TaxID=591449 RepID=A0AC34Q638_9BILA
MAKFEVQVRSCFCCGLSIGTLFILLYTLLLYSLLTGLASWGLSDTAQNGDKSHYTSCDLEAQGKINADNRKLVLRNGQQTVIIEDSTSYHCSFGLYTEELKYPASSRSAALWFNILLYVGIILASLLGLLGLALYFEWLLLPWIILMCIDIFRGFISTFLIFWYSYGNLARLATGLFFLGIQFLHISLVVLMIAKFQRMYNRKHGVVIEDNRQYEGPRPYPTGTLPSNYNAYSPQVRRNGNPNEVYGNTAYSDYSPSTKDARYYDNTYRQPPPPTAAIRY